MTSETRCVKIERKQNHRKHSRLTHGEMPAPLEEVSRHDENPPGSAEVMKAHVIN